MKTFAILFLLAISFFAHGQIINTATMDTADYQVKGKVTVEGYLDAYYAYNFNKPIGREQPYLVSMSRHNETNVNLAFVDVKYSSPRVRARIAPGFGTYMNSNYSNEPGTLKNFVEANVGYRVSKSKNVWIDAGILGSPYTNESAISKDQLAYTRSLSAEYAPYYLSGVKLTLPFSAKVSGYLYLINGWQQITDQNSNKSIGTQLEWRPANSLLVNWNTFVGNEQSAIDSTKGFRTFSDLYIIYQENKWSVTSCVYAGHQESTGKDVIWWQANLIARYALNPTISITGRIEYFNDKEGAVVNTLKAARGFKTSGTSLGINITPDNNLLVRTEVRYLFSDTEVYQRDGMPSRESVAITTSACIWF